MYIDITDTINVNKKLIKITNPTTAIYFAILVEVLKQVKLKKTYDKETGYFKLDRKYIVAETGINVEEQRNCDSQLVKLGILGVNEADFNQLKINMKQYFDLLVDETCSVETVLPKSIKATREQTKKAKLEGFISSVIAAFRETDPELVNAYRNLVEIYYNKGYVKIQQWTPVICEISNVAKTKLEKLKLVEYMIGSNWQNLLSVIDAYKKKKPEVKPAGTRIGTESRVCTEIDPNIKF